MWICAHTCRCKRIEVRRHSFSSFPPPRGTWGLNSGCQAWSQVILPTKQSCQLSIYVCFQFANGWGNFLLICCRQSCGLSKRVVLIHCRCVLTYLRLLKHSCLGLKKGMPVEKRIGYLVKLLPLVRHLNIVYEMVELMPDIFSLMGVRLSLCYSEAWEFWRPLYYK